MALKLDWLMRCVLLTLRSKTYLKKQEPEMAKKKTFSFAHLIGLGASASEEEEDKKAKKAKARRAEEDERKMMPMMMSDDDAEEDERDDDAEDDGDDPDASEDDDSEDDGDDDRKESKAVKMRALLSVNAAPVSSAVSMQPRILHWPRHWRSIPG
jgi:hypothetical protein